MKYQFTTEGSIDPTRYHQVSILDSVTGECLHTLVVSTPLSEDELCEVLGRFKPDYPIVIDAKDITPFKATYCGKIYGLANACRVISNIKPLKQKVVISICGEKKTYELDADKLETLLKSLE